MLMIQMNHLIPVANLARFDLVKPYTVRRKFNNGNNVHSASHPYEQHMTYLAFMHSDEWPHEHGAQQNVVVANAHVNACSTLQCNPFGRVKPAGILPAAIFSHSL
jgi:hypothetical protein